MRLDLAWFDTLHSILCFAFPTSVAPPSSMGALCSERTSDLHLYHPPKQRCLKESSLGLLLFHLLFCPLAFLLEECAGSSLYGEESRVKGTCVERGLDFYTAWCRTGAKISNLFLT